MALIKFGAVIVDSRGSIGGTTIKGTRAGPVMQNKSRPISRYTPAIAIQRARFAELSRDWWNNLDEGQRTDWRALAAANPLANPWGDEFAVTGLDFYIRTNMTLLAIGEIKIADAPANQTVTALATLSLAVTSPNDAEITFTATPTPADHVLLIRATPTLSPGINNFDGKFSQLTVGGAGETSPFDIATPWLVKIGEFVAGKNYAIQACLVQIDNGARSAPLIASTLAA